MSTLVGVVYGVLAVLLVQRLLAGRGPPRASQQRAFRIIRRGHWTPEAVDGAASAYQRVEAPGLWGARSVEQLTVIHARVDGARRVLQLIADSGGANDTD